MDPFAAYKEGGLLAVAMLLFLFNFIQNFGIKKSNDVLVEALRQANLTSAAANQVIVTQLMNVAQTIADGQDHLAQELAAVVKNQELLATNQMNLTHTNNEVVRELINIIRDGERG
jgi:hypothetical protein